MVECKESIRRFFPNISQNPHPSYPLNKRAQYMPKPVGKNRFSTNSKNMDFRKFNRFLSNQNTRLQAKFVFFPTSEFTERSSSEAVEKMREIKGWFFEKFAEILRNLK